MDYNGKEMRKQLITYRKIENNLSMQEVANLIGISKATYSRLENGNVPDVVTYAKVIWFLHSERLRYFGNNNVAKC